MFDHIGFTVRDFAASCAFFSKALAPLGTTVAREGEDWAAFGRDGNMALWIGEGVNPPSKMHIAFAADTHAQVQAFYDAAIAAGGLDNGGPGPRLNYSPTYYGAFVIAPGGHNVEAVCRAAEQ